MPDTIERAVYAMGLNEGDYVSGMQRVTQANLASVRSLEQVSTSEEKVTAAMRSTEAGLQRRIAALSPLARVEQDYQRGLETYKRYVTDAVGSDQMRATYLELITKRHQESTAALTTHTGAMAAFGTVAQDVNGRIQAMAGSTGILGGALSALGPVGIGVAVGIGTLALGFKAAYDGAHQLASKAEELHRFSEITGLTTDQVQALRSEAAKFGTTSEEAQTAILHFTQRFNELRDGSGALLTQVRLVDAGLADQMQTTTSSAAALTLLGQAMQKTDDFFQKSALAKAATGRGGLSGIRFLEGINVDDITKSFRDAGKGIDQELIEKLAKTNIEINRVSAEMSKNFQGIFAAPLLSAELNFYTVLRDISREVKNLSVSDVLKIGLGATPLSPVADMLPSRAANSNIASSSMAQSAGIGDIGASSAQKQMASATTEATKTIQAQIADAKQLAGVLGSLTSVTDQMAAKQLELTQATKQATGASQQKIIALRSELLAQAQVNAENSQVSAGTYTRQLQQIQQLKATYDGLTATDAARVARLNDQLNVITATTGEQRKEAEFQAQYNDLIRQGKTEQEALTLATAEQTNKQAELDKGARDQLAALQDQNAVINAGSEAAQRKAESEATYNQLLRQGVSELEAGEVAAQQLANANDRAANAAARMASQARAAAAAMRAAAAEAATAAEERIDQAPFSPSMGSGRMTFGQWQFNAPTPQGTNTAQLDMMYGPGNWQFQGTQVVGGNGAYTTIPHAQPKNQDVQLQWMQQQQIAQQIIGGGSAGSVLGSINSSFLNPADKFQLSMDELKRSGSSPESILAQIKSGGLGQGVPYTDLLQAIDSLTSEVQSNTDATQANTIGLSGIYGSGHAAIGYYQYGSGGAANDPSSAGRSIGAANSNVPPAASSTGDHPGMVWSGAGVSGGSWVPAGSPYVGLAQLADGGYVPPGGMAYVGEHGPNPRFIRAGSDGITVTPQDVSGNSGGRRIINNTNIFNFPGDPSNDRRRTMRMVAANYARGVAASA